MILRALEQRATYDQAVTSLKEPAPWLEEWFGARSTASGVRVNETTALRNMAVYGCVRVLAESVASLPLILYRRVGKRDKERANDHPLYMLAHDTPNPFMTSFTWREQQQGFVALWGNAYSRIEQTGGGDITALYPLQSHRVRVLTRKDRIDYEITLGRGGGREIVPHWEMLHVPGLSWNGLVGASVIGAGREAIGSALAQQEFGAKLFSQGAHPKGVVETPSPLSDTAYKRLTAASRAREGLSGAHRTLLLEEGATWKTVGIPPEDAQFLESQKFGVIEVCRLFRMQPHKIMSLDNATFSNIEHQAIEHVTDTLRPWLVRWEQELNRKLLTDDERREMQFKFLVDGLLRGDATTRHQVYTTGRQWGYYSANDVLELEDRNGIGPQGDIYMVPMNMIPAEQVLEPPPAPRPSPAAPDDDDDDNSGDDSDDSDDSADDNDTSRASERRQSANALRLRSRIQRSFQSLFLQAFERVTVREREQVRKALRRFLDSPTEKGAQDFFEWMTTFYSEPEFRNYIERQIRPLVFAFSEQIADAATEEIGADAISTERREAFAGRFAESISVRYTTKSRTQLTKIVQRKRDTPETLVTELESQLDSWEDLRALNEARHETIQGGSAFAKFAWAVAGVTFLRWVAVGSETCPLCESLDGRVVGIEEPFVAAGDDATGAGTTPLSPSVNIGHPPLHDGCVCMIAPD